MADDDTTKGTEEQVEQKEKLAEATEKVLSAEERYAKIVGKSSTVLERRIQQQNKLLEQKEEEIRLHTLSAEENEKEYNKIIDILEAQDARRSLSAEEYHQLIERRDLLNAIHDGVASNLVKTDEQLQQEYKQVENQQKLAVLQKEFSATSGGVLGKLIGMSDATESMTYKMGQYYDLSKKVSEEGEKAKFNWMGFLFGIEEGTSKWEIFANIGQNIGEKSAEGFALIGKEAFSLFKALDKAEVGFRRATNAGEEFVSQIREDTVALNGLAVTQEESAKSLEALYTGVSEFSTMNKESRSELNEFSLVMTRFGVDAKDSAEHIQTVTKTLGMGTKEAIQIGQNFESLSQTIGIPVNTLMTGFKKAMPKIAVFGKKAEKVFTDLAKASKATGVEVSQLLAITDQFDTFEGAAQKVGELNAILGTSYLSSIDMVMTTDPTERLELIQKTVESSGKSWSDMGYYMKKAVAEAAGISDMETAERIFRTGSAGIQEWKNMQAEAADFAKRRETIEKKNVDIAEKMQAMWLKVAEPLEWVVSLFGNIIDGMHEMGWILKILSPAMALLWAGAQILTFVAGLKEAAIAMGMMTVATEADTSAKVVNASAGTFAAHSWMPFVGVAIAAALVGGIIAYMMTAKSDAETIASNAQGVTDFKGGLSLVGEQGPELVNLPGGSNVITNENTNKLAGGGGAINYERLASAVASGVKNALQAADRPVIIKLNDREFGRAVMGKITKEAIKTRIET